MTNQMQGEILFVGWDGGNDGEWAYTPWMPVRGDFATFGVEMIAMVGALTLTWEVQTRTAEDPGTTDEIFTTAPTMTATGISQKMNNVRCMQMVRYRFKLPGTPSTDSYVIIRALMPSWQTDR